MQKVVGSSPIIRFDKPAAWRVFLLAMGTANQDGEPTSRA
jgi:hypothetical protein